MLSLSMLIPVIMPDTHPIVSTELARLWQQVETEMREILDLADNCFDNLYLSYFEMGMVKEFISTVVCCLRMLRLLLERRVQGHLH